MRNYFSVTQFCLTLLIMAAMPGVLQARTDRAIADSGLFFSVVADRTGFFSLAAVDASPEVLRYDLTDLTVAFTLAEQDNFDNPLFCFYFGSSAASVQIRADNASGHLILDERGLSSDLEYHLGDSRLAFTPSEFTQCFYVDASVPAEDATFGLFGVAPAQPEDDQNAEGRIFADGFQIIENPSVSVSFEGIPDSVAAGDTLVYDIVIENSGDVALDQLAFQEIFPGNPTYFPAALVDGTWTCSAAENIVCPPPSENDAIRLEGFSLPAGQSIRYAVSRKVAAGSAGGSMLVLYAGAVDGAGQKAPFDVARAEIPVVGTLQRFEVSFTEANPTVAIGGVFPDFTIRAVDSGGNTISTFNGSVGLTLRDSTATLAVLTPSNITWINGVATISNLDVPSNVEGSGRLIRVEFSEITGDSATFDIDPAAAP